MKGDESPEKREPCCGEGESTPEREAALRGALTRRSILKGAGAAVVAGASGGGVLGAAAAIGQTRPTLPWDIRNQVQNGQADPPAVQAIYDDINRMNILIGDVPFAQLFRTKMRRLVPVIASRIPVAQTYGLVPDPVKAEHLARELEKQGANATVADFYVHARSDFSKKGLKLLVDLRRIGLRIPVPGGEKHVKKRDKVVRNLVRDAGFLTFHEYYSLPGESLPAATRAATAFARQNLLLGWGKNGYCCATEGFTRLNYCVAAENSFCALADGPKQKKTINGIQYDLGICVDASDRCAA